MVNTSEQYVQVQNLTDNPVVYLIEEDNIRRDFGPYETKTVTKDELQKLYYKPGGAVLLQEFLRVEDKNIALEFGVSEDSFEHEYSWDRVKVDNVLLNESLDALHDALDFAPEGIVDLIIQRAIALKIADVNKRELIFECTGKNIDRMIANQVALDQAVGEKEETEPKKRRVATQKEEQPVGRRAE